MRFLDLPLEYFLPKPTDASALTWGRNGPATSQLSDRELLKRLSNTEVVDQRHRCNPTRCEPADRRAVNKIHAVLFQEAVKRGLRRTE